MIIVKVMIRFRVLVLSCLIIVIAATGKVLASDHSAPVAGIATSYPAVDVHDEEKVAIAADPYDTPEKIAIFRVDYLKYGFMPIRIIVSNNGDKPISLKDARIHFITATGDKIPAAEAEDVERRTTTASNAGKTIPLPAPLPPIHRKPGSKDKQIEEDFASFEYSALAVEAHTTRAGFLFYDIRGLDEPLKGARLYLRMLHSADGKDLFYFEIPFDKYLAAPKATPLNPAP